MTTPRTCASNIVIPAKAGIHGTGPRQCLNRRSRKSLPAGRIGLV
jgi:hypothetical protein